MVWLRLLHIVSGAVWVGSAVFIAFFLLPTARAAGPDGGRFVGSLMRRMGPALGITMLFTLVPGFIMYGRLAQGASPEWFRSGQGLGLGLGAAASILAIVAGAAINGPAAVKLGRLRQRLESAGGAPSKEQAAELAALQGRSEVGLRIAAVLLVLAAGAMATARYF